MTITIGWWGVPALITMLAWAYVFRPRPYVSSWDFTGLADFVIAVFVTLLAWLIYFAIF